MHKNNMETKLYYTAPDDKAFDEVKMEALIIWAGKGDTSGKYKDSYPREKVSRVMNLQNIKDNFMCMVGMFDLENQRLLASNLSEDTRNGIRSRMIDGGADEYSILF